MRRCIEIIEHALVEVGASLADVARTRIMVVNMEDDWEAVVRVHEEVFGSIRPAAIMYEVSRFMDPEWLIEIEVDALLDPDGAA